MITKMINDIKLYKCHIMEHNLRRKPKLPFAPLRSLFHQNPFDLHLKANLLLSVFSAFACMHNIYPMYRALKNTSVKRYSKVVHSSIAVSSLFYIAVALAGYITFTNMSQGILCDFLYSVVMFSVQNIKIHIYWTLDAQLVGD